MRFAALSLLLGSILLGVIGCEDDRLIYQARN